MGDNKIIVELVEAQAGSTPARAEPTQSERAQSGGGGGGEGGTADLQRLRVHQPEEAEAGAAAKAAPEAAGAGGAEAAAAGGAEGLAAAAGPIGLAVVAAKVIGDKVSAAVTGAIRAVGDTAEKAGRVGTALVRNDNRGAAEEVAGGMAQLAGKLPVVGDKLQAVAESAIKVEKAFLDVVGAFVDRGRQLQVFSPELAAANARADVRTFMADAREADTLGPGIARLTDTQSELMALLRDILLPVKKIVVESLGDVLLNVKDWIERNKDTIVKILVTMESLGEAGIEALTLHFTEAIKTLGAIDGRVKRALDELHRPNLGKLPLDKFLELIDKQRPRLNQLGPDGGPARNDGGLNVPLLRGLAG